MPPFDRNTGPLEQFVTDTQVYYSRIIDVDVENYSVSAATLVARKVFTDIPFATPYQHFANGEGIYFMPEVGSMCWICEPSDQNRPFVLGWAPVKRQDNGKDMSSNKMPLNPGDIYLGTRDENFLILRRGGVLQIGGGPLSQRVFLPLNNTIKDLCENYSMQTIAGDLNWTVERNETTTTGDRPTSLTISARMLANDKNPIAVLRVGNHSGSGVQSPISQDADIALSLSIKASGDAGAEVKIKAVVDKTGKIFLQALDDVYTKTSKGYTLEAGGNVTITSSKSVSISASESMNLTSSKITTLSGQEGVSISSGTRVDVVCGNINIGDASATEQAVLGNALMLWLSSHKHTDSATGSVSTPPNDPPSGFLSQKVKVS